MSLLEGLQVANSLGLIAGIVTVVKWIIRVETRLAVIESKG